MKINEQIKYARRLRDITQKQLGRELGYSEAQICHLEKGSRKLKHSDVLKIEKILNIKFDEINGKPIFDVAESKYEPILVCQKPNEGTYANNALKHGVSGLNIDRGRIGYIDEKDKKEGQSARKSKTKGNDYTLHKSLEGMDRSDRSNVQGRFPANIILDEEAGKMLDEQSGESKSSKSQRGKVKNNNIFGEYNLELTERGHNDKGGASRFFYVAKASKAERNMGCEGLEDKQIRRLSGGKFKDNSGSLNSDKNGAISQNNHPTVKPLKLMEYLCTLTKTPTGGIVLDLFAGSGTTGMACKNTDRDYILIEKEKEYIEIAQSRLKNIQKPML